MKAFLPEDRPVHTCREKDCVGCDMQGHVVCHFQGRHLAGFLLATIPACGLAGVGLFLLSPWMLLAWLVFFISFFALIEIRVLCSHCPHYGEPETRSLKCWANYGSPKVWKFRPGPMAVWEKWIFFGGLLILFVFPAVVMAIDGKIALLAVYGIVMIVFAFVLSHFLCSKCMNFACPLNRVDHRVRERFFRHHPVMADAWSDQQPRDDRSRAGR